MKLLKAAAVASVLMATSFVAPKAFTQSTPDKKDIFDKAKATTAPCDSLLGVQETTIRKQNATIEK